MRLLATIFIAALLLPGVTAAQDEAESLESAVDALTREWFDQQNRDVPPEGTPEPEELESEIADMREEVIGRISGVLETSDALADGVPDDAANTAAMARLVETYQGLEGTTPLFTKLALSNVNDPAYRSGWRLFAIRGIAETWLPQTLERRAQLDAAALPPCEADLRPVQSQMLPLSPLQTEFRPGGRAVVHFAVDPTGAVSSPWFTEWQITPYDDRDLMRDYIARSVQGWRYPPRQNSCRLQRTITFELSEGD